MGSSLGCSGTEKKAAYENKLVSNQKKRESRLNESLSVSHIAYIRPSPLFEGEWKEDRDISFVTSTHDHLYDRGALEDTEDVGTHYQEFSNIGTLESTEELKHESQEMIKPVDRKSSHWVRFKHLGQSGSISGSTRVSPSPKESHDKGDKKSWTPNRFKHLSTPTRGGLSSIDSPSISGSTRYSTSPRQHTDSTIFLRTDSGFVDVKLKPLSIHGDTRQLKSHFKRKRGGNGNSMILADARFTLTARDGIIIPDELSGPSSNDEFEKSSLIANRKINPNRFLETFLPILKDGPICLATIGTLDFDVFKLERLPKPFNTMPLLTTTVAVLYRLNTIERLKISWLPVVKFLIHLENAYHDHFYHSNWHAADVVGTMAYFFRRGWFRRAMSPVHHIITVLAAASHDVDHDAANNAFHRAAKTPIGTSYASSNLERHHVAKATSIRDIPGCDWTTEIHNENQAWTPEKVWKLFTALILRTDPVLYDPINRRPFTDFADYTEEELAMSKDLVLYEILHLADISNPAKPHGIATKWAAKYYKEFQALGKESRRLCLDIPMFKDPLKMPTLQNSQIFFISKICLPSFEDLVTFLPEVQETVENLQRNLEFWKSEQESLLERKKLSAQYHLAVCPTEKSVSSLIGLETPYMSELDIQSSLFSLKSSEVSWCPSDVI